MVKPLYIVFFFFALSLCEDVCVTLARDSDNKFSCAKKNGQDSNQNQPTNTIDICNQLGFTGDTKLNPSINDLLKVITTNDDSKAKLEFSSPNPSGGENSGTIEICYKLIIEGGQDKKNLDQHNNVMEDRLLKNQGNNPSSNILPAAFNGQNQKPRGSLIMAI